ncbi:putative anti-sigma factor [Pedobacter sp. BAL39]|uniref:FecR family protein n=1 Tax=Pedobacter sp. BAL39 TaxID=391596 RepID=UPI000155AB55|nr:FecR family protein [Pedobacter sp. BAL39]EDM34196.1 putative anti-sigma factor [Pedobacter sp. BAL39]
MSEHKNTKNLKHLLSKYLRDEVTDQERNAIEAWYKALDQHSPQQDEFPGLQSRTEIRKAILQNLHKEAGPRRQHWIKTPVMKYTAAVLLLGLLAFFYSRYPSSDKRTADQVITTGAVSKKTLTLPDGSVILLNAGGSLTIASDFNDKDRKVKLTGEAFFTIAKDKSRPFIIQSGKLKTTVLGTSFNINAYPDLSETKIAVATGKVKVVQSRNGKQEVMLAEAMVKNQVLVFNHKTQRAEIKKGDTELLRLWADQKLYIDNYAIGDIAKQLSRHYNIEVVLDPKMDDPAKYTIMLGNERIQTTAEILSELTHHTFYIQQNKLFIMKKR